MYALVDCNNFYASCERVFNPPILHRPVIVLSNNDGCVIARTNEAKALGFKMGDPFFKVRDLAARHGVAVFSSNYTLYGDMSSRVMQTLERFAPEVEIYSIDEAFLNLAGFADDRLAALAADIRRTVRQWTGIPVSRRHRPDQDAGQGRQSPRQEGSRRRRSLVDDHRAGPP